MLRSKKDEIGDTSHEAKVPRKMPLAPMRIILATQCMGIAGGYLSSDD